MSSRLVEILFANKKALLEAEAEYQADGSWHVDMCNCDRCQAMEAWLELPWRLKLTAKLAAFVAYGTC